MKLTKSIRRKFLTYSMTQGFLCMQFMYTTIVLYQGAVYSAALTMTSRAEIFLMLPFCMFILKLADRKGSNNALTGNGSLCLTHIKRAKCQCIYRFIRHNSLYLFLYQLLTMSARWRFCS